MRPTVQVPCFMNSPHESVDGVSTREPRHRRSRTNVGPRATAVGCRLPLLQPWLGLGFCYVLFSFLPAAQAQWSSFTVNSADGTPVAAVVSQPAGTGPFPLVVHVHAEPGGQGDAALMAAATTGVGVQRWQALHAAGFAVCLTDYRGHPPGQPFSVLQGPVNATDDLVAVLDFLLAQPYVDATRVGFIGESIGGVIVLETFQDDALGPAVLSFPLTGPFLGYAGPQLMLGCTQMVDDSEIVLPLVLARIAPIASPILFVQGTLDPVCPLNHKLHEILLGAGKDSTLVDFPGSFHGFTEGPASANFDQAVATTTAFFASELGGASPRGQVSDLTALHQSGQTFLTWTELPGLGFAYRVYGNSVPFTSPASLTTATLLEEVDDRTSENLRQTGLSGATTFFRIGDLGPALTASQGLFVHTVATDGLRYYAVTTVTGGVENTSVIAGENALGAPIAETVSTPRPVLQSLTGANRHYVHWVSDQDTPFASAMWNRPSRAFNLRVVWNDGFPGPRPVLLKLHARGGNYQLPGEIGRPEAVVLSPDDWIGQSPDNTFWYGMNEAFPNTAEYEQHLNVDYTVRRVMAELDFVLNEPMFQADADRVFATGNSMGALGSVFLAYRFPDRFAAVHATVPKFDFGCSENQCWLEPANGDLLWGTPAQNLPTSDGPGVYDRLDLGFLAQQDVTVSRPLITAWNGRNDVVVGWPEKPYTYAALTGAHQPTAFFWDERDHMGSGGVWGTVMNQRRDDLWTYRLGQAMPAFSNFQLDDDPGDGDPTVGDLVGCVNGYLDWDVASVADTPQHHEVRCFLRSSAELDDAPQVSATVDWTPRRLQQFTPVSGAVYRFRNLQGAAALEVENRFVTADTAGLITVTGAVITVEGNRFRLETVAAAGEFRRGDANGDGIVDIADPVFTLLYLFGAGPAASCQASADVNDDALIDISDPISELSYLFAMGPAPPAPGPEQCGPGTLPTELSCERPACP
ncbi:MAG: prolyl oligopeptidase family serine peptidase [Planctomycetota bacterium]